MNEKEDWPYRGFDYLSLFSDSTDLATWGQRALLYFCNFQQDIQYKAIIAQMGQNILNLGEKKGLLTENIFLFLRIPSQISKDQKERRGLLTTDCVVCWFSSQTNLLLFRKP